VNQYAYKPVKFFAFTISITWVLYFLAVYFSYQPGQESMQFLLTAAGGIAPSVVGLFMIYGSGSTAMKQDFLSRLLQVNRVGLRYLPGILFLVPVSLLAATAISVLFGQSPTQFRLVSELSLLVPVLAPTFEEIAWRGYGVDSLRSRHNLLTTSLLFALLWALWHVPLFFGNGYYQHELWKMGLPYVLNFFVSLVPFSIILNWLYYKTNRSILTGILYHVAAVITPEAFGVEDSTKFIQTAILVLVAVGIVAKDRAFFSSHSSPTLIESRHSA
jgi:uncharacterized protein